MDHLQNQTNNATFLGEKATPSGPKCYDSSTSDFVNSGVAFLGAAANILNVLVFSQAEMRKNTMNVYLLAKSASDLYFLITVAFRPWTSCVNCSLALSYGLQIFKLFYVYHAGYVAQISSMMLETIACFDRYVAISQYFIIYKK